MSGPPAPCQVHGHLLKPGDVQRTPWRLRCAQPPYDALPIPRADLPPGVILSREADAWIREARIEDTALPLYEGRMIGQFDFSQKGWVSGKGRTAVWRDIPWDQKQIEPQYLMDLSTCQNSEVIGPKLPLMNISSATNARTLIAAYSKDLPCNHSLNPLRTKHPEMLFALVMLLNSFVLDAQLRIRLGGLNISFFVLDEVAALKATRDVVATLSKLAVPLSLVSCWLADSWLRILGASIPNDRTWKSLWVASVAERYRKTVVGNCVVAAFAGLHQNEFEWVLRNCDLPSSQISDFHKTLHPTGFWRVDKDIAPEVRHTILSLIAFHDLEEKIRACGGDLEKGIEAFLNQNDGEGWLLPETLRLETYGLGRDERAKKHQPVASRLGPRFYDWQLTQPPEESWRECHLHARNLLGEVGYQQLLKESESSKEGVLSQQKISEPSGAYGNSKDKQGKLFE